jgi:hypothetical protein
VYTYYNSTASTSYSASADTTTFTDVQGINFNPTSLAGFMGRDQVCIESDNENSCVEDFDFFQITSQDNLGELDGVLGLAPPTPANGPSFVTALD